MARTRGGGTSSAEEERPRAPSATQAPEIPPMPSTQGQEPPSSVPERRYDTRAASTPPRAVRSRPKQPVRRPSTKRARTSAPGESSTRAGQTTEAPDASQTQAPAEPTVQTTAPAQSPEALLAFIQRPLLPAEPIEGNADCRARDFHDELFYDLPMLTQQPELRDSLGLIQRYFLQPFMTPRDFFYPRVVLAFFQSMTSRGVPHPTMIHFTIDGRHGILDAKDIADALRIPHQPRFQADFRQWAAYSQRDMVRILSRETSSASILYRKELPPGMLLVDHVLRSNLFPLQHSVQRRGDILEALFRISEGFYFGPHHLIMAALFYFEEKVHRKKLHRAESIPLLFPRLLCRVLEHLGFPVDHQAERRQVCRDVFTLEKWRMVAGYIPAADAPPQEAQQAPPPPPPTQQTQAPTAPEQEAQQAPMSSEPPIASTEPEGVQPTSGEPSAPSQPAVSAQHEPSITISAAEFHTLLSTVQTFTTSVQTLARQQEAMAQQMAQYMSHTTAILQQIQQHLGLPHLPEAPTPTPSAEPVPVDPLSATQEAPPQDIPIDEPPQEDPTVIAEQDPPPPPPPTSA